jgi:hypothetical protein
VCQIDPTGRYRHYSSLTNLCAFLLVSVGALLRCAYTLLGIVSASFVKALFLKLFRAGGRRADACLVIEFATILQAFFLGPMIAGLRLAVTPGIVVAASRL